MPELAIRPSMDNQDHHVGRGGAGNEHHHHSEEDNNKKKDGAKEAPRGLADKLKAKLTGVFKK